jgi:hypothetical protein
MSIFFSFRNAGRGIWNSSKTIVPRGSYFGPYRGQRYSPKEYAAVKESGFAWELLDSSQKRRVVGFVDPGPHPDEKLEWLALVNSANFKRLLILLILSTICLQCFLYRDFPVDIDVRTVNVKTYPVFSQTANLKFLHGTFS